MAVKSSASKLCHIQGLHNTPIDSLGRLADLRRIKVLEAEVARRQRLTTAQIAELFDPPAEQRELVRHFTLSEADLAAIGRSHGDHNRLGHALMLCYLRYPGRALRPGERPPAALLAFCRPQTTTQNVRCATSSWHG